MTEHHDDTSIDYLWDPDAPVDPDVRSLELRLRPMRFDPAEHPLTLSAQRPRRRLMSLGWKLAAAAAVVAVCWSGFLQWRLRWPTGRAWDVSAESAALPTQLAVGATLSVPASTDALVEVARIGSMRVDGGSSVTLRSTQGTRHRLAMDAGQMHVRVWAPPGSVSIQTPAGEVIDLGCEFNLQVGADVSHVRVRSGWVQMENLFGEVLIPEGASSEMRRDARPGVPVYDSAPASFRDAVRQLERSADQASLQVVLQGAGTKDVLTLLLLADRRVTGSDRLVERAAELFPPPAGITVGRVVRGDREALWKWYDALSLPSPKGWMKNWRDGLPRWLIGD